MKKKLTKKILICAILVTTQLLIYKTLLTPKELQTNCNWFKLSKQTKIKDPQHINFIGKIERQNNGVTMLFIIERSEETTFEFSQNSVNIL